MCDPMVVRRHLLMKAWDFQLASLRVSSTVVARPGPSNGGRQSGITSKGTGGGFRLTTEPGTKDNPWRLKTPPGTSSYEMYRDERDGKEVLVCTVGKTVLYYDHRCIADLHKALKQQGDWIELGAADEQKPARDGTVEAWARSPGNPIGGWYGLRKGLRGRFGMYIPPLMEAMGLAELEHNAKNNRMRAK